LAEARGWSKETVTFMARVFSELEFITIKGGLISLRNKPEKRDLSDSAVFREKQRQAELENDLCYSSYSSLKQYFEKMMTGSQKLEGALK
jgi:single-stranded-DNA-specific exonuclease